MEPGVVAAPVIQHLGGRSGRVKISRSYSAKRVKASLGYMRPL